MALMIQRRWQPPTLLVLHETILFPTATSTAWVLACLFLALNGYELKFDPQIATQMALDLAVGDLSEKELTVCFCDHLA